MLKTLNSSLDVLKMFTRENPNWGGRELSKEMDIDNTKVYRILETLSNNNFLMKDLDTKRYSLGFAVWELGMVMYEGLSVKQLIRPILEQLSEQTGESIFLTIEDRGEGVTLDVIEPKNKVKFTVSAGSRAPLYVGASYRVILAYKSVEFIASVIDVEKLTRFTKKTIIDPVQIRKELEVIKEREWAISQSEYTEDIIAIAVPLFQSSEIIGSITVSGPTYRMTDQKQVEEYLALLMQARDEVSEVVEKYQLKLKF